MYDSSSQYNDEHSLNQLPPRTTGIQSVCACNPANLAQHLEKSLPENNHKLQGRRAPLYKLSMTPTEMLKELPPHRMCNGQPGKLNEAKSWPAGTGGISGCCLEDHRQNILCHSSATVRQLIPFM